jgi:hypothetical protein
VFYAEPAAEGTLHHAAALLRRCCYLILLPMWRLQQQQQQQELLAVHTVHPLLHQLISDLGETPLHRSETMIAVM